MSAETTQNTPAPENPGVLAVVTWQGLSAGEDVEMIATSTGHEIQYGHGSGGGGFCYRHQSFSCLDNLSEAEREAIKDAR